MISFVFSSEGGGGRGVRPFPEDTLQIIGTPIVPEKRRRDLTEFYDKSSHESIIFISNTTIR